MSPLGGVLVLLMLGDVFFSLWHPSARGLLSHAIMSTLWRLTRRAGQRARHLSGPLAMMTAIGAWGVLVILGGALVYWPHLEGGFNYAPGVGPATHPSFVDALYISIVTTATLGLGDIVPTHPWLRVVLALQALVGFALLTASVTWVVQVYPALGRRRALSLRLAMLARAGAVVHLHELTPGTGARLLDEIATALDGVRTDLNQYAESYYFHGPSPDSSLALTIGLAVRLAHAGADSPHADVRLAAAVLGHTLDAFALLLDRQFLRTGLDRDGVLAAYTADHLGGKPTRSFRGRR